MANFLTRSLEHQRSLSNQAVNALLDAGRRWNLAPVLRSGGAIIFPHATLTVCGHQIAAAVHACLDCEAETVLALGVLHALAPELQAARTRVAEGGDPARETTWGIQGPGLPGREDWRTEFSLSHFEFLFHEEVRRRGLSSPPKLILRYPNLATGRPEALPGFSDVMKIASDAVVMATIDPCHHGIGYGDAPADALAPELGGLEMARTCILDGMQMLCERRYIEYIAHCIRTRSDGRDVGQLLASLIQPRNIEMLDLLADDMTGPYKSLPPTWVAGALMTLTR